MLNWKQVDGADGYVVYMYNSKTGKYEFYQKIKKSIDSDYTFVSPLEPDTEYKFRIAAYVKNSKGKAVVQTKSPVIKVKTLKASSSTSDDKKSDTSTSVVRDPAHNIAFTAGNIVTAKDSDIHYEWMYFSFVPRHSVGIASNGQTVDIEAEYGVTENCSGTKITFNLYNHTGKKITVESAKVDSESVDLSFSKNVTIDTKNYKTGYHKIEIAFSTGKSVKASFYVNTDAVSTCITKKVYAGQVKRLYLQRRIDLNKAFDNLEKTGTKMLDYSTSLALDKFYYPNYDFGDPAKYRCDTQKWIDLSNSLVEKDWSKEHKAYVIYDWIIRNIAFDKYNVKQHYTSSRSAYHKDWSGKWHVWDTKCGVCFDYANILAIMYRAQGIPTVLIGSDAEWHDWNAAYINGRWIELDASLNAKYKVETSDVNKRTEYHSEGALYSYCGFNRIHPDEFGGTADDMVINDELMYGDPNDKNSETHYLS